ncbi:MAG: glutathione peroxidase [Bdellovibrionota bacterium]
MAKSVLDFTMKDIKGRDVNLSNYKGKVLVLVNVASKCGLTPQYEGLQELYERYKDRGLEILAFPANDFMGQEPGTNEEIASFCSTKYDVTFPLFGKISVKGEGMHPLYQYLTKEAPHHGDIKWNFHKFIVDKNGEVVANVDPKTTPNEMIPLIDELL